MVAAWKSFWQAWRPRLAAAAAGVRPQTPRRWVGLDLGSASIKLAELEAAPGGGIRLVRQLIQELPPTSDQKPVDRAGWLQSALKEVRADQIHLALSGQEVAVRRLHIPPMSPKERVEAVKWQVKDQIGFPIQDAVLDFQVVGEVWDKDLKKADVLVAAASTRCLHDAIQAIEQAGARVASITPTPLALWASIQALVPDVGGRGGVVLVELGAETTHVAIVKGGSVRAVRDLALGSANLTEALIGVVASERGDVTIDHAMAEAFTRRYGVLTDATDGTTEEGVPLFHIASLMRPVLENLVTELSRFLDFYKLQMEESGVSRVLLCGGGAGLKSLSGYLADGLGVTVEVFNPLVRITDRREPLEPDQVAEGGPRLAAAIGAALQHGQAYNLLPAGHRLAFSLSGAARETWKKTARKAAVAAAALYLGLWVAALGMQLQGRKFQAAWTKAEPAYAKAMQVISTRKAMEGALAQSRRFMDEQPVWEGLFRELSQLVPPAIELETFEVTGDSAIPPKAYRFQLKGRLTSSDPAAHRSISELVEVLERSPFFAQARLSGSEMRSGEAAKTSFSLNGVLE